MAQQSLAQERSDPSWIDEAFLWTAASLAVIAISAAAPPPSLWTQSMRSPAAEGRAPLRVDKDLRPQPRAAPLISFSAPVPGYPVISPFGLRKLPWEEHGRLHQGVDIAAPSGTPVLATSDGIVERTGVDGGYGRFVEVRHADGLTSLYGHLSVIGVQPGARVNGGQPVGQIGSTGSSTGSHLHFEIHDRQDRPLNPELFLGRAFQTEVELPLRQALRAPRGVRVAYVSFIPRARREQMLQREADKAAQAEAAANAEAPQVQADQKTARPALLRAPPVQQLAALRPGGTAAEPTAAPPPGMTSPTSGPVLEHVVLAPVIVPPTQPNASGRVHARLQPPG